MLSRLSYSASKWPFFNTCIATLRTHARAIPRAKTPARTVVKKDWEFYGKIFLGGSAVLGGTSLCIVGLKPGTFEISALARSVLWPEYVKNRMQGTYVYFGLGLVATAATMMATKNFVGLQNLIANHPILSIIGFIGAQMAINSYQRSLPYTGENMFTKHILAGGLYTMIGTLLGPMLHIGGPIVSRAALYTGALVFGLTMAAVTAPSEHYLQMSGPLMMGFCVVAAASIATAFVPQSKPIGGGLYSVAVYGGVVLFSALMLYQTQQIVKQCECMPQYMQYDPISMSIGIYMTTINLFIRIASILSNNRRK